MKKHLILTIPICLFFVFIIGMIIFETASPKLRDFSGKVISIDQTEEYYRLSVEAEFGGTFYFKITDRSSLYGISGERIAPSDIKVGGQLLLDVRKPLLGKSDEVKELVYFTGSENQVREE